jgi:serine/threonine protein phosphatase 1
MAVGSSLADAGADGLVFHPHDARGPFVLAALKRIFGRPAPAAGQPTYPGLPDNRVVYAVGDIHGRADLLAATFAAIDDDVAADRAGGATHETLEIYLGDYVDRGPQSRQVVDLLIERKRTRRMVCLAGNHESVFFRLLRGEATFDDWSPLGGRETLMSYSLSPTGLMALEPAARLAALHAAVPEAHRAFFAALTLSRVVGPYVFVHAGIRPAVPIEAQNPRDLMWIRREFLDCEAPLGAIVVHGHTPVPEPDFRPYRINIDTGAYMTGRLTCLKIDAEGPLVLGGTAANPSGP